MADKFTIDTDAIRQLAGLLRELNLSEIDYADGDRRVSVRFMIPSVAAAAPAPVAAGAAAPAAAPASANTPAGALTSPMVGTAYLSPEPSAAPFVKQGDKVREGQTVLIIEAMKVMNAIRAPRAGTVTRILVSNGAPVEYGEPLLVIE